MEAHEARINFTVDKELATELDGYLEWGMKSIVGRHLIEMVVEFLRHNGSPGLGLLIGGHLEIRIKKDERKQTG